MGLIASSLIKQHLKKVVRPAAGGRLDFSFKNGKVELREVEVNCDLFEGADLPFDFSWIHVGCVNCTQRRKFAPHSFAQDGSVQVHAVICVAPHTLGMWPPAVRRLRQNKN